MVEGRSPCSFLFEPRKCLFGLFAVTLAVFVFSWLGVLQSAGRPHFLDHSISPDPKLLSVVTKEHSQSKTEKDVLVTSYSNDTVDEDSVKEGYDRGCDPNRAVLRVYMYDLSSEFHFGMLGWKGNEGEVWPDVRGQIPEYPGGLNFQHSIEYWLTLDLLSSRLTGKRSRTSSCAAVRVYNSSEADVVFVPFFSSLSYNRFGKVTSSSENENVNKVLQDKLVQFLVVQDEWKRSNGRDHVILAHHPNSMLDARSKLWHCMFILSDFGRYPQMVANVEKDIIAPYKHVVKNYDDVSTFDSLSIFDSRPTLLYFQGAIYRKDGGYIRQELYYMLKDEKDVHFAFGSVKGRGISDASQGMHSSKFCLNIAGDTPSSNRLFDAIASHCVPVIISNEIELPYEDVLDYSEFCVFVRASDALRKGVLLNLIRSIGKDAWTQMWRRLKEVEQYFEYQYPSKEDDAVQMIWKAISRKVPAVRLKINRSRRFHRFQVEQNDTKLPFEDIM